jgi:hypothetical protein
VDEQERESAQAVAKYQPKNLDRIDDLGISAVDLLRHLPGVVQVEITVIANHPTHRLIHLRNWHFVPKYLYAIDLKSAHGRELSDQEIDDLYQELLLEVEAVQLEQMALLRCLIKYHGLKRIYCEGLTAKDVANYQDRIAVLQDMEKNQITELRKQLAEVRDLVKGMEETGRTETERYDKAKEMVAEITGMLDQHNVHLLELGAPGRLLIAGEIEAVLPLDDADLLEQARPIAPGGKTKFDPAKLKARRDGQVKAVLANGVFGLIVLGGSHVLSDSVRRLGKGRCEYLRVTTRQFKKLSE